MIRHIRHKHPTVVCAAGVSKLDAASAAATLADYMNTWARKKFVPHSRRRSRHPQSTADTDQSSTTPHGSVSSAPPVTAAAISHAQINTSEVAGGGSAESLASDSRLVIDSGSEDFDDRLEAEERDQRDADQLTSVC